MTLSVKIKIILTTTAFSLANLANAADIVISSNTSGTQSFSSGTDSITINTGITLSTTGGSPAISGFPSSIANYGIISTGYYSLILNAGNGTIGSFINEGTVNSSGSNALNLDAGTITTLTNTGSITAQGVGINVNSMMCFGSCPTIINLNNKQGGLTPLTYSGNLPTSYNIIIGSGATTTTGFGRVAVSNPSGTTTFGISSLSGTNIGVAGTRYQNVISGLAAGYITNEATTLTYTNGGVTATYQLLADDGNVSGTWDLSILSLLLAGPSATDTQSSLHALAPKLRSYYNQQAIATNFANMNTYDCDLFDAKGVCLSVGGQQTYVDSPSSNMTSAVVVAGYKVSPQIRIGGFLNPNVNSNTGSNVDISNKSPLMGLFAVWNQNENHLGYQVKIANAYQDKDVTTTRDVVGTSEAGTGSTTLNTQSYVGELSYAFLANEDKTLVRPYAAVRYTRIKQDGYTETSVSTPLTYAALEDRSTTALVGVKLNHKLAEKVNLTGSIGVEQDLDHQVDNLTATGVSGLTSENFNDSIKRTRPVASIGAYYMPVKNQRISADLYYQQLPFQSTGSATAYVNYMIGF